MQEHNFVYQMEINSNLYFLTTLEFSLDLIFDEQTQHRDTNHKTKTISFIQLQFQAIQ